MPVNKQSVKLAKKMLGDKHGAMLEQAAGMVDKIQQSRQREILFLLKALDSMVAESIIRDKTLPDFSREEYAVELAEALLRLFTQQAEFAIEVTEHEQEFVSAPVKKMAKKPPAIKIPKTLLDLRKMWDKYRNYGEVPARPLSLAEQIKKAYIKKVREVWKKHSGDFLEGRIATKDEALKVIKKASDVAYSRAKMIVETETTSYYNKARREIYDKAEAVTHYLFLAIRDQRTTKWCTDKVVEGKRGRHGLVYAKGDTLTQQETPAIHWNCRSEMVPLVPWNPRHAELINNKRLLRRNNTCHPLPKGWG